MTTAAARGPAGLLWRIGRRPLALVAVGYLAVVTVAAVAAPVLAPYDPNATDLANVLSGPTGEHPLGTDTLGRDVLSRLMHGGRLSLLGVAEAVLTVLVLGVPLGLAAGYLGGWTDRVVSWVIDIALAMPVIVVLLMVVAVMRRDVTAAMVAVGVLGAPDLGRVVRGAVVAVRAELYFAAARVAGLPNRHIIARHVLPRILGPVVVRVSLFAGGALLVQGGLSYLGLGAAPPTATWGGMVAEASTVIGVKPWLLVPPGVGLGLAILAFGLVGDAVRDVLPGRTAAAATPSRNRRTRVTQPEREPGPAPAPALSVRRLTVDLPGPGTVVAGLDLDIGRGETVGLVGESGCGKTITARAVLGLLPAGGRVTEGSIHLDGRDVTVMTPRIAREVRGRRIALVGQEPMASLDPVLRVGRQVGELVRRHDGGSRAAVRARTRELLAQVSLPDPDRVARQYPHELSGGMAQRVAIAMALAGRPDLLVADEPTTALDTATQTGILSLLRGLQHDTGMSMLLISHDWTVIGDMCRRAYVMYAGQVVESAPTGELLAHPRHPYTIALLGAIPHGTHRDGRLAEIPGSVPAPGQWPAGCHFEPRCPVSIADCGGPVPLTANGHPVRCVHWAAP